MELNTRRYCTGDLIDVPRQNDSPVTATMRLHLLPNTHTHKIRQNGMRIQAYTVLLGDLLEPYFRGMLRIPGNPLLWTS